MEYIKNARKYIKNANKYKKLTKNLQIELDKLGYN